MSWANLAAAKKNAPVIPLEPISLPHICENLNPVCNNTSLPGKRYCSLHNNCFFPGCTNERQLSSTSIFCNVHHLQCNPLYAIYKNNCKFFDERRSICKSDYAVSRNQELLQKFDNCINTRSHFQNTCISPNHNDITHPGRIQQMIRKKSQCQNIIQSQTQIGSGIRRKYKRKRTRRKHTRRKHTRRKRKSSKRQSKNKRLQSKNIKLHKKYHLKI